MTVRVNVHYKLVADQQELEAFATASAALQHAAAA
jgi:hypothetical protein